MNHFIYSRHIKIEKQFLFLKIVDSGIMRTNFTNQKNMEGIMKKLNMLLLAGCTSTLLAFSAVSQAGMPGILTHPSNLDKLALLKPDLTVTSVKAVQNGHGRCYLRVGLKNSGIAPIPDSIYKSRTKVGIQMYVDNKPGGGMSLWAFDQGKKLQRPGQSFTRDWFKSQNNLLHAGIVYKIKVVVDSNHELKESKAGFTRNPI